MGKRYDQNYFDRWYRDPRHRVKHPQELARKVALAVHGAEYFLGRPLRSVIDVGCGEGAWRAPLLALRPKLRYIGLDSSAYAVARYGTERNLHQVAFADLPRLAQAAQDKGMAVPADLLVCADMMHYLTARELQLGLPAFQALCGGAAFLETLCREDAFTGDRDGFVGRPAAWYRRLFAKNGWIACGAHLYLGRTLRENASALELQPLRS